MFLLMHMSGASLLRDELWLKAFHVPMCGVRLSIMCSLVLGQGGAVSEGLPTVPALVWLLSCVDPAVLSEVSALPE